MKKKEPLLKKECSVEFLLEQLLSGLSEMFECESTARDNGLFFTVDGAVGVCEFEVDFSCDSGGMCCVSIDFSLNGAFVQSVEVDCWCGDCVDVVLNLVNDAVNWGMLY